MKVLFAVSDENISTSIVKKYQKQYKEIISYKNVYYFNAILKELQRNKSYDRVVISEDLEEFTSTSYEQKDKFIFDRLDNISDEAVSNDGSDIPIILICSERRNKSEEILVKLFGIGIYNAIIGDDRSQEEVCRLINKPRTKKEAKIYYRIDIEDVNYAKEKDSDVSEVEMQNILTHFKRLGKNEDKYAESFRNIVSQYNEAQLRIIIEVLPDNVKEVLKITSPEYKKIMSKVKSNTTITEKKTGSTNKETELKKTKSRENVKGTSEKLLETEEGSIMSKPVVVPTTLEKNMYKKVAPKKTIEVDLDDIEDDEIVDDVQEILNQKPKRRGRPKKSSLQDLDDSQDYPEKTSMEDVPKKKRGRPRKNQPQVVEETEQEKEEDEEENEEFNTTTMLPGFEEDDDEINESEDVDISDASILTDLEEEEYKEQKQYSYVSREKEEIQEYDNVFSDEEFESLLTGDKKIATFIGTSKNGTSFIVNNVANILSEKGVNTAILDATSNKNSYYIYTKNDEELRKTAINSVTNLMQGNAQGIKVNSNLTVYTTIPSQKDEINNSHPIMETLIRNHTMILIDCDFTTPIEYFERSQEMYLIQSMDVLTIQPLTEFLRDLKAKNVLDQRKIRIIINKLLKVKGVSSKNIIGGMANYNDPEMSFMTELFDKNTVKVATLIPFDEDVYAKYLEGLIECEIKTNGYPKEFRARLNGLAEVIYPLLPNNKNSGKKNKNGYVPNSSFSSGMNNTLDNMRKKY